MTKTALAVLCGIGIAVPPVMASEKISAATMTNLQAAFNGESNAHARYLAFANKASEEGYEGVASLFRAAARAEEIHATNHAAVLRAFGGMPDAKIESAIVKSTRENLSAAIKGETYERDEMYPVFIRTADGEKAAEAVRTFQFALAAEAEHANLYADAMTNLAGLTTARVFYVCPVCGFTTAKADLERCPTCTTPKERFEQIS